MMNRRHFNTLVGSAAIGLVAAPHVAHSQSLPVVRLGNAAGIIDPQLIFLTMGQHPRLKYYEEEGCKLDIINMSGSGQTLQKSPPPMSRPRRSRRRCSCRSM
jgi:NitT/TauT family transport system substrate-binding protein